MDNSLERWVSDETKVSVFYYNVPYEGFTLAELNAVLEKARLDIPKEFRAAAKVEFERGDVEYGDPMAFEIYYLRPTTDAEKEEQRQDERDRRNGRLSTARAEYERLKKILGET